MFLLCYRCLATVIVQWLLLMVPWVGLQCVIVVFPGHTHLPFYLSKGVAKICVPLFFVLDIIDVIYYFG